MSGILKRRLWGPRVACSRGCDRAPPIRLNMETREQVESVRTGLFSNTQEGVMPSGVRPRDTSKSLRTLTFGNPSQNLYL